MADERSGEEKGWPNEENGFQLTHQEFVDSGFAAFGRGFGIAWEFLGSCSAGNSDKFVSDWPTNYTSNLFFS